MKIGRYCAVCKSTNKDSCVTLFSFPRSPTRKKKWKEILKLEGEQRVTARICARHFSKSQFVRDRLTKTAIPSRICVDQNKISKPPKEYPFIPIRPRIIPFGLHNDVATEVFNPLIGLPNVIQENVALPSSATNIQASNRPFIQPRHVDKPTPTVPVQQKSKLHRRIYHLTRKVKRLEKENEKKIDMEKIFSKNPQFYQLLLGQVKRYSEKTSPYTTVEKTIAISIFYSCGRTGYKTLLLLGLKLPTIRTLSMWMKSFNFSTGINSNLLLAMKNIVEKMDLKQRDCIMVWDEMSIKELLQYNKYSDRLDGIVDLGHLGRSLESATEVLVFMVQGINFKWKFPLSFYFSNHNTKADCLVEIIQINIAALQQIGLKVRMCVCDMAFTNQSVYKKWEITNDKPYSLINEEKIYFVHDTPHLVKLVRNNLLKHNFDISKGANSGKSSLKVKWMHISQFFNKDKRLTSRMAPKLSNAHLFLKDFSKMKVKLAVQLFSHSVYAGMMSMVALGILKKEACVTAQFVSKVNNMFDLLNISKYEDDKPTRCAKNMFIDPTRFEDLITFIESVSITNCTRRPDFLRGLELTLRGIQLLCSDLRMEGYEFIYTRQLQQDCLENFFSAIRMKGGFCQNPSVSQFRASFKYLFFVRLIKNPGTGNTESKNRSFVTRLSNLQHGILNSQLNDEASLSDKGMDSVEGPDPSLFFGVKPNRKLTLGNAQMQCVVNYFGSATVFSINAKTKCKRCHQLLTYEKSDKNRNRFLVDFKQFDGKTRLAHLSKQSEDIFFLLNKQFDKFIVDTLREDGCKVASGILEKYLVLPEVNNWLNDECRSHRLLMIKFFVRAKLNRLVKDKNDAIKQVKSWQQTRRDLRNQ